LYVLDSNVWIIATIEASPEHVAIREEIARGAERAAVSAYIYNEVVANIQEDPNVSGADRGETVSDFTNFILTSPYVDVASQAELEELGLGEVRAHPANVTLGRAFGIQPKDAPIVSLAITHAGEIDRRGSDEEVTIIRAIGPSPDSSLRSTVSRSG
jgi:predicted nucleic acid-binding protein